MIIIVEVMLDRYLSVKIYVKHLILLAFPGRNVDFNVLSTVYFSVNNNKFGQ